MVSSREYMIKSDVHLSRVDMQIYAVRNEKNWMRAIYCSAWQKCVEIGKSKYMYNAKDSANGKPITSR